MPKYKVEITYTTRFGYDEFTVDQTLNAANSYLAVARMVCDTVTTSQGLILGNVLAEVGTIESVSVTEVE